MLMPATIIKVIQKLLQTYLQQEFLEKILTRQNFLAYEKAL